jgi:hypothetical protein
MLSMEKGSGLSSGSRGLLEFPPGRNGWKRIGGVGSVGDPSGERVEEVGDPCGDCGDPGGEDDEERGLSVTRISGLAGGDEAAAGRSFSEGGGLDGSTTSMGRLSMLIMLL